MLRAYSRLARDPAAYADDRSVERFDARRRSAVVAAALKDLRRAEREVLLLHAWAELSDTEIADALSLPLGTVKSRLSRARERFRNQLDISGKEQVDEHARPSGETA